MSIAELATGHIIGYKATFLQIKHVQGFVSFTHFGEQVAVDVVVNCDINKTKKQVNICVENLKLCGKTRAPF